MYVLCLTIIRSNLSALNSEFYDAKCDELDFTTDFWNQVLKTLSTNLIAAAEGMYLFPTSKKFGTTRSVSGTNVQVLVLMGTFMLSRHLKTSTLND